MLVVLFAPTIQAPMTATYWRRVGDAHKNERFAVGVTDEATLDKLSYKGSEILYYVADPFPKRQKLIRLTTESGNTLRVTTNHPLLNSEGMMKSAKELGVGELLVRYDGKFDAIVNIESEAYFGKVYNFDIKVATQREKIVLANGFLNGTNYFQELGHRLADRLMTRGKIVENLRY